MGSTMNKEKFMDIYNRMVMIRKFEEKAGTIFLRDNWLDFSIYILEKRQSVQACVRP